MTTVYFVRHAEPNYENHNDMERELTARGLRDRERVTAFLRDKDIHAVLSSPYKRAIDTVKAFADEQNLPVEIVNDFRERKVDRVWIEDYQSFSERQWADFDYKLSGGESLREVQQRNIAALKAVLLKYPGKNLVVGSHGTALGTIISFYDPSFGYEEFDKIKNIMPWVVKLTFEDDRCVEINQRELCGKVTLVGAGPSDPGLLTLKGKQALESAEAVVYDALVGQGILNLIPDTAEAINVGKRASHHTLPQEQISRLLVQKAKEGKRVVRLKGGDPFLFGRGGEEIEELFQEGIPYEVVPGVTSALAVPAYQGIPVTHRDFCSSVHIITGHKRTAAVGAAHLAKKSADQAEPTSAVLRTESALDIDFEALVRAKGTLIFLMGVSALGDICRGLLAAGMDSETPAALLMQGTTAHQRRILATVSTLEEEVRRQGSCTPAIIVVGEVCSLSEQFSWVEQQPLCGVKVLLTRPKELISETAAALRAKGAEVLEIPAIRTEKIVNNERLEQAFERLDSYQWIVFTSAIGVRIFFEEMAERGIDCRALGSVKFAVIGNGTKKALACHGFYADLVPDIYDAAHLGRALREVIVSAFGGLSEEIRIASASVGHSAGHPNDSNPSPRILIPRAAAGSPELIEELGEGFFIDDIPTYETRYEPSRFVDLQKEFACGAIDYVMFTSASTVRGFAAAASGVDYTKVQAVCIGKQTGAAAEALGMKTWVSAEASIDSLIERLCEVKESVRQ